MKDFKKIVKMADGRAVGEAIANSVFAEEANKGSEPVAIRFKRALQKSSEAQDEARRESTRGIQNKKRGGKVKK